MKINKLNSFIKNIFFTIIWFFSISYNTFSGDIEWSIIPDNWNTVINVDDDWRWIIESLFTFTKDSIFGLLALISITVFIFIWARLVMAKWSPEDFKKAILQLVYAIVWLALIAISWGAVKLVSSLNI